MTLRSILPLALGLLLAACASTEQAAQRDNERCVARGLQPETKNFNECMTQLETERVMRKDARYREQIEKSANPFR